MVSMLIQDRCVHFASIIFFSETFQIYQIGSGFKKTS